jgi:transposase
LRSTIALQVALPDFPSRFRRRLGSDLATRPVMTSKRLKLWHAGRWHWHRSSEVSKRLEAIPGVGPLIASALVASIPDPTVFRSGRDLSAWIGLVPKQHSTGGKERLGNISKAGNRYLRKLLVVGALSVIRRAKQLGYTRHPWLVALLARRSSKIAAVALANKIARIAWAMMARKESYQPSRLSSA